MAFSLGGLSAYTEQQKGELLSASIFGAKTISLINKMAGVKSAQTLNLLSATGAFQADSGCAFNTSGTTAFTQRTLTVSKIKVQETFCPEDLEAYYTQMAVQPGSTHTQLPFEQEITSLVVNQIKRNLEVAVWQGDTTLVGSTTLKQFDGLLKLIDAAGTAVTGNTGSETSITSSNALAIFEKMYSVVPTEIIDKEDLTYFCGWDTFRKLVLNLRSANLFHYSAQNANGELSLPWAENAKVIAVNGLNNDADSATKSTYKNRIICARKSNLFFGTDLLNEEEKFKMWYSDDDMNIKLHVAFKAGTQVAFPSEIVQYTNA